MPSNNRPQTYGFYPKTLQADETITLTTYASFLTLLKTSDPTNYIFLTIDDEAEQALPARLSIEMQTGETFKQIQLRNSATYAVSIEFAITNGRIYDNRLDEKNFYTAIETNGIKQIAETTEDNLTGFFVKIDKVLYKRELVITNNGSHTMYIGDGDMLEKHFNSMPAILSGTPLPPGGTAILTLSGVVYIAGTDAEEFNLTILHSQGDTPPPV